MVVAEISAGLTSLQAALGIVKAMANLRDVAAFQSQAIELQQIVLDAMNEAIEAREAHSTQVDRIRALEAEVWLA
jgi:hypothetical protein